MNNNGYIYLFIRRDLSPAQQIIQTAHAIYRIGRGYGQEEYDPYAVLIGVENEKELLDAGRYLLSNGIDHETFYEPDIKAYTAIATKPLYGDERKPLLNIETYK